MKKGVCAWVTSQGEVDFVRVGVICALLAEPEDANGRSLRHLKEPAAAALCRHAASASSGAHTRASASEGRCRGHYANTHVLRTCITGLFRVAQALVYEHK